MHCLSHSLTPEETQRLLGADGEPSLAADEQAPPPPPLAPAIINPPTANVTPSTLYPTLGAPPVIMDHNDPPPEYTPVVQGQVPMATNMGYPIQLQLEGQLVPATLMRDVSTVAEAPNGITLLELLSRCTLECAIHRILKGIHVLVYTSVEYVCSCIHLASCLLKCSGKRHCIY